MRVRTKAVPHRGANTRSVAKDSKEEQWVQEFTLSPNPWASLVLCLLAQGPGLLWRFCSSARSFASGFLRGRIFLMGEPVGRMGLD
jgi:hypothetical protein